MQEHVQTSWFYWWFQIWITKCVRGTVRAVSLYCKKLLNTYFFRQTIKEQTKFQIAFVVRHVKHNYKQRVCMVCLILWVSVVIHIAPCDCSCVTLIYSTNHEEYHSTTDPCFTNNLKRIYSLLCEYFHLNLFGETKFDIFTVYVAFSFMWVWIGLHLNMKFEIWLKNPIYYLFDLFWNFFWTFYFELYFRVFNPVTTFKVRQILTKMTSWTLQCWMFVRPQNAPVLLTANRFDFDSWNSKECIQNTRSHIVNRQPSRSNVYLFKIT